MTDKNLLKDLHYLSDFSHTGNLDVYHSLCNKFCPKRLCFSMHGMISRTMIAVLDHNCSAILPQATTSDGTLRYKEIFSKISGGWCMKKIKCAKKKHYVQDLLEEEFLQKSSGEYYKLPGIPKLAKNIGIIEKPDKEEAVKSMRTRFSWSE